MRVGIFSGTFDPVHRGHIGFALKAFEDAQLDEVVIFSEAAPKRKQPQASYGDRLAMLKLATAAYPQLVVDRFELQRSGAAHTMSSILGELDAYYDQPQYAWIVGEDTFDSLARWPEQAAIQDFLNRAELLIARRPGQHADPPVSLHRYIESPLSDISSSAVRAAIARGERPEEWLESSVLDYIEEHELFRNAS